MNILRWGSGLLERTTPAGLMIAGATLALTLPSVRRGLRSAAVLAARGVLSITDEAMSMKDRMAEDTEDLAGESGQKASLKDNWENFKSDVRTQGRRAAVTAAMGALTVSDRAKSFYRDASGHIQGIVEEARSGKSQPDGMENPAPVRDGLEAEEIDIGRNKPL